MYTHTTLHAHNQTNDAVLYVYLIQVVACLRFKLSDVWDLSVIFWVVGLKKQKEIKSPQKEIPLFQGSPAKKGESSTRNVYGKNLHTKIIQTIFPKLMGCGNTKRSR